MTQSTVCPNCGAKLVYRPTHVGKMLPCPKCGTKFVITDPPGLAKTTAPTVPSSAERDDTESRADLLVIESDRTLVVPVTRSKRNESLSLGSYFISPSGRTALVAGNGSQPESIFWLEIDD